MESNGFYAEINLPDAPEGDGIHALPPYNKQDVYLVDEYKNCPNNWPRNTNKISSYFIPIVPNKHMWLDFNENIKNQNDVAIIINVQGINPITGQKPNLKLEQYHDICPIHNTKFENDRNCHKCGYKWPAQNYISTVSTPLGQLWIDGWRTQNGEIRGFLTTEETTRGIASQLIGDDKVYAISIAFFKSLKPKPIFKKDDLRYSKNAELYYDVNQSVTCQYNNDVLRGGILKAASSSKQIEIGAGVKIKQELSYYDNSSLKDYESEPSGIIYINYCTINDFNQIIKSGRTSTTKIDGYLSGLKIGN